MTKSAVTQTVKPTSSLIKAALRLHYPAPEYATLEEVRNATGRLKKWQGKQPRYCDFMVMSLWPSLGLEVMGFEVKVSRADWLNEIKDTKKAVAVAQFCDRWYLVVPDAKIVKEGELPAGWGMLVVEGNRVREVVSAPKREALPITREFLASLMRNATTSNPDYSEVQAQIAMGIAANRQVKVGRKRDTVSALEVRRLKKVIADYELQHGVKVDTKSRAFAPVIAAEQTEVGAAEPLSGKKRSKQKAVGDDVGVLAETTLSKKRTPKTRARRASSNTGARGIPRITRTLGQEMMMG